MRRPVRMSVQRLQNLARRTIERNGIRHGSEAVEIVLSVLAGCKGASEVHLRLVGVLLLVQSVRRRVPYVDHRAFDWLAGLEVGHCAVHPCAVPFFLLVLHDVASHLQLRCVVPVEGAQDGGCGGLVDGVSRELVCDFVDEGLEAEDVAEKLPFVAFRVGHAAGFIHLQ